jgi:MFS family permease
LLASYAINELGDSIGIVALSLLVYDQTSSPLATTALFVGLKFVPALLAPLLTARLDQSPLRRSLPGLYAIEALVFVALSVQVSHFALWAVLALAILDGVIALTGRGLSRGATAALLAPSGALREGNALLNVAFGFAGVLGLAAGGLLASAASLEAALLADAGSFAAIAVLLAVSRDLPAGSETREPFRARLRAGFAHVRSRPEISRLLIWQSLALVLFTLVVPIEVVYAKETLNTGDAGFGTLLASWAAGILIGGVIYARGRHGAPFALVLLASAAIGLGYLGMGLVRDLTAACLFSLLGGIGNGAQWIAVVTMLQEATPDDLQARITGLLESVAAAAPGVGFVLGGTLTQLFSPPTAYLAAGVGVLLLVAAASPLLRPQPLAAPDGS